MTGRGRRRFAALGTTALPLAGAGAATAHDFPAWSGIKAPGGFAWEAKRLSCGNVGDSASRLRAHTHWAASPANGYLRLTFTRQIRDADTGAWTTVHRQRRSTKNKPLEGSRTVIHWTQWFFPFEDEGGATSRHVVAFEWLRDRSEPGADPRVLRRTRVFGACVVAP
ncbi:MAG: hypothetical protein ACRDMU_08960 [Gaiellaceae bacterium]